MIDSQTIERAVGFHGHMCVGLALGVQAARIAMREVGNHAKDEEVVAVVETDRCAVDAIQVLTGCTFGKGNLIHRDWGKNAYTFFRRSDGRAVRLVVLPSAWQPDHEHDEVFAKVRSGLASPQERSRFEELHLSECEKVLSLDAEELFTIQNVAGPPPERAQVHVRVSCDRCSESTMETHIRRIDGRWLCPPCFEAAA